MTPAFKDHFSSSAAEYAAFRPRYPAELFDWLAGVVPGRALAWDAGTGNGQAAVGLAERFARVVATDASRQQIAHAARHPGIAYRVARVESSGLPDGVCDLVTAAQALHWFDPAAFLAEARRALRAGGVVAAWSYVDPELDDPTLDDALQALACEVRPYWPPERPLAEAGYSTLPFPFAEIPTPHLLLEMRPTLAEFGGYLRTWSATQRYVAATGRDPVAGLQAQLAQRWSSRQRRLLRWPLLIRAGRV